MWNWQPLFVPAAAGGGFQAAWVKFNSILRDNMKKNVASQSIGAQMVTAADGTAFTGTVTVYVTGDAGTQALGSVGSGVCTHEGNGYHTYAPAQAETNYDQIAFTFIGTGAVPQTIQVYTNFPQTVDNATNISAIKTKTDSLTFTVANQIDANIIAISSDNTAADNLEATFDGTGYTDDKAPATQSQIDSISVVGVVNAVPAESYTLTTGTQSANTYTETAPLDGVYHEHTDDAGTLELYYQFDVGDGVPSGVRSTGYLTGNNDSLGVFAYNWTTAAWQQIGTRAGSGSTANQVKEYTLYTSMVGTGANLGKVRIRFYGTGLSSATLAIDQIYVTYSDSVTAAEIADAVWDDLTASHVVSGSFGEFVGAIPTAAQITTAVYTTQMTESYAADGVAPTLAQAVFLTQQAMTEMAISGTTLTVKKLDGTTTAATFTLDSATAPTSRTRAS